MVARRALIAAGCALASALPVFTCSPAGSPRRSVLAPPAALEIAFAGCRSVSSGPVCVLGGARRLRLWLAAGTDAGNGAELVSSTDRGPVSVVWTRSRNDDGIAGDVTVPARTGWLIVERRRGGQASARWRLTLAEPRVDPLLDEAEQRRHTDAAGADELLAAALVNVVDPDRLARIGALRARIALGRGRTEPAIAGLRAAFEAARRAGRVSDAAHDGFALAHVLIMDRLAFAEGRQVLAQVAPLLVAYPEGKPELAYYEGLLGLQAGDLRAALRAFEAAARDARHLGLTALEGYAETQRAIALATVGRDREALALGRQIAERAAARRPDPRELPCNRAEAEVDLAWIALILWRDDEYSAEEPGALLARARAALVREGCTDPIWQWNMALNEALFAIARGDGAAARARLATLRTREPDWPGVRATGGARPVPPPSPYLAVWADETEGRLALSTGQPARAVTLFAHEEALARAAGFRDGLLRAEIGSGRALLALGRRADAAVHLTAAHDTFEGLLRSVPLGEGRDSFLQSHDESGRFLIEALVELGRAQEAFVVARIARARSIDALTQSARVSALSPADRRRWDDALAAYRAGRAALERDAENDWQLPSDQLARVRERRREQEHNVRAYLDDAYRVLDGAAGSKPSATLSWPAPGELYVAYVAIESGWIALLATSRGVLARPLPGARAPLTGTPAALSARLFAPIADELGGARRVRFFPPHALGEIDLHSLPFAGHPLGDVKAVEYGVDISSARSARTESAAAPFLVVDDPTEDLGTARLEARDVVAALGTRGVQRLQGPDASRERVLEALPLARAFHYAGHGSYAGIEGLDSALPLARGGRLLAADVLALPSVPRVVTLSACEAAGGSAPRTGGVPLGLAEAFLASGAVAVVAPSRSVDDRLAGAVMRSFYRALEQHHGVMASDLAGALGGAEREVRENDPGADWSAFRVLVR